MCENCECSKVRMKIKGKKKSRVPAGYHAHEDGTVHAQHYGDKKPHHPHDDHRHSPHDGGEEYHHHGEKVSGA